MHQSHRTFTAEQAAQIQFEVRLLAVERFTAEQAAQKDQQSLGPMLQHFTAEQAAQKEHCLIEFKALPSPANRRFRKAQYDGVMAYGGSPPSTLSLLLADCGRASLMLAYGVVGSDWVKAAVADYGHTCIWGLICASPHFLF